MDEEMENSETSMIKMIAGVTKTNVTVDSANVAILEIFTEMVKEDAKVKEYPAALFALNMVARLTEEDIRDYDHWDDNDPNSTVMLGMYTKKRNHVLEVINL